MSDIYRFYNTAIEQLVGPPRSEPYRVDGRVPTGDEWPQNCVDVKILRTAYPTNLTLTQKAEPREDVDLTAKTFTYDWHISEMSDEEVRQSIPTVTRRQMKKWLIDAIDNVGAGELNEVRAVINSMPEGKEKLKAQVDFADAQIVKRTHPLVEVVRVARGWSHEYVDAAFREAALL